MYMAGLPHASTEIVDLNLAVRMRNEVYNLATLLPEISKTDACLQWLARRGLIRNTFACTTCGQPSLINADTSRTDGKRWYRGTATCGSLYTTDPFSLVAT